MQAQNWGQISPSSTDYISEFLKRTKSFTPPEYPPFDGHNLVADLRKWNSLCHTHYLEHVSFRARTQTLIAKGSPTDYLELERLAIYRQDTYSKLIQIWEPLEKQFLDAMKSDENPGDTSFFDNMDLRSTSKIVEEVKVFANTSKNEMAERAKMIAQNLSGIAMADGAIATSAWAIKIAGAAAGSRLIDALPGFGLASGVIFGVAAAGAASAFAYHMYMTSKELQKIRAIGLDLYYIFD